MVAFSGFHLFLSSKGMTTIEFLTRPQSLTATVEPGSRKWYTYVHSYLKLRTASTAFAHVISNQNH